MQKTLNQLLRILSKGGYTPYLTYYPKHYEIEFSWLGNINKVIIYKNNEIYFDFNNCDNIVKKIFLDRGFKEITLFD